ncbi:NUDIX hydrolase [Shinella curvata]|uniref:NUDIX hydrolase n=1 Tax=Shinella curvata TaxID=1817964 RepID=A0ABT8XDL7_9HYPH|nr:NUDIX hydrolase [Shinella curvata]MCJ8055423.1 NUDIX hydrolase [Shinella curvata]MDO6121840.1 NUDIX hydrolase [Shinella curvata]
MIRIDRRPQLFSFRVAGLIFRDGYILAQRGAKDDYWALPGGRAEIGESSEETVLREMREELHREARIERLVWTVENFFTYEGYAAHELGFYYLLSLDGAFPFHETDIVHRVVDGVEVEFRWLRATPETLTENRLKPQFIAGRIDRLPASAEHLIVREGLPLLAVKETVS